MPIHLTTRPINSNRRRAAAAAILFGLAVTSCGVGETNLQSLDADPTSSAIVHSTTTERQPWEPPTEPFRIWITGELTNCDWGEAQGPCPVYTTEGPDGPAAELTWGVQGLDIEPGTAYVLDVEYRAVEEYIADYTSHELHLVELVEQRPAGG